jgi:hypothetical protein
MGRAWRRRIAAAGREEVERAMRPVLVVMAAAGAEYVLEMASVEAFA